MSEIQRCVWCDRPKATAGDWDRLAGGEGDWLCWEPMRCESAGSESVVTALRAALARETERAEKAEARLAALSHLGTGAGRRAG